MPQQNCFRMGHNRYDAQKRLRWPRSISSCWMSGLDHTGSGFRRGPTQPGRVVGWQIAERFRRTDSHKYRISDRGPRISGKALLILIA